MDLVGYRAGRQHSCQTHTAACERHRVCAGRANAISLGNRYIALKRKNPAKAGFHSGQRRRQSLWPRSRGISAFRCGERDLVSQFCRENSRLSSFQPPPTPLPDAWNQDALGPGSNSCRSRGSLHGSRYSRLGATRKGEKAMAGQRKNPTTGAVTVLKPTNRQTPKRAGGAVVNNPRKSGTPVGSGSRVAHLEQNPHCVESCETLFLKADRRGSHASGSHQERRVAIIIAASGRP